VYSYFVVTENKNEYGSNTRIYYRLQRMRLCDNYCVWLSCVHMGRITPKLVDKSRWNFLSG